MSGRHFFAFLLVLWFVPQPTQAAEQPAVWPQWRGPARDGQVAGPTWPATLRDPVLKRRWRVELGSGYSGPVVAPDRVFVTESQEKSREVVRALDRRTGKELWRAEWQGTITVPSYARANGDWVRSTPAYDGASLYVLGLRDVLVCLDAANGKERWRVDFVARYQTPVPPYGATCSPLVDGEAVYVQAAAAFVKLDKKTGKVLWRVLPYKSSPNGTAVSSPVLVTLAGKRQLVVQQPKKLAGVDPESGAVLWTAAVPAFRSINILTPTIHGDRILTSAFGGRTFLFKVSRSGDRFTAAAEWTNKAQGYMSSPVVVAGHAYLLLRNQRLACLDLATGTTRWLSAKAFGKYWSMVAQGDRILALDERGTLYLLRANPEKFELLDERKVSDEETWAHLAVCGDEVFVRALNAVAAYRWGADRPRR